MFKQTTIRETELAKLKAIRADIVRRTNYDKQERLRKQREEEMVQDYWMSYARSVTKRTGRGAR